jgi:acyl-CoA synthetase (AMP-forming)/AMP-acid ligase II
LAETAALALWSICLRRTSGGQTEALMSTFFGGGTAVLLEVFDAGRSLRAIAQHRVEILGQIPAMFNLEWMLKDYDRHDLSSLKFAAYGGQCGLAALRGSLAAMAPVIGTGLGLTEAAGFCTYVQASADDQRRRFSPGLVWICPSIHAPFASPCATMARRR